MLLMLVVLFSFGKQTPGISGKVTPGDAVVAVWAVKRLRLSSNSRSWGDVPDSGESGYLPYYR